MTDYLNPHRIYPDCPHRRIDNPPGFDSVRTPVKNQRGSADKKMEQDLIPQFDAKASYHGKAKVTTVAGHKVLVSNGTNVASIITDKEGMEQAYIFDPDMNGTALRHTKEFLRQNGFKADTKEQMLKDYYQKG